MLFPEGKMMLIRFIAFHLNFKSDIFREGIFVNDILKCLCVFRAYIFYTENGSIFSLMANNKINRNY